jgi:hypothetical protein
MNILAPEYIILSIFAVAFGLFLSAYKLFMV